MPPLISNIVNAIRTSGESRAATVGQMRADTRTALMRHRSMRAAAAVAIRQALRRHRAAVIGSLRSVLAGNQPAVAGEVENEDRAPAPHVSRRETQHAGTLPDAEPTSVWQLWAEPPGRQDATTELLQALRIIQDHPEGICVRDIGNELGIDWRRVPGLTRSLLEAGLIEQVEQEFYPTGKATGR
jgi:DNA-binding transcriptional ArsR family regulator